MIKAIFFDIDGTLLSHSSYQVDIKVSEALLKLHEQGILLFIATGRSRKELLNVPLHHLPFDGYMALNGQLCYDQKWNVIHRNPINKEDIDAVLPLYYSKESAVVFTQETSSRANFLTEKMKAGYQRILLPVPVEGEILEEPIYQITIHNNNDFVAEILRVMPHCTSISWHGECSDVIPKAGGKHLGLQAMMNYYGLKKEEVMAFGDADNDAEMLKAAGIGVAMGNGTARAKAAADWVTDSIDENGLVNALKHFDLIQKNDLN